MSNCGAISDHRGEGARDRRHLIRGVIAGVVVVAAVGLMLAEIIWPMAFAIP